MMDQVGQIEGFILAGGSSSRMGRDKALLKIGGVTLLERTERLVKSATGSDAVVVGGPQSVRELRVAWVADDFPKEGPLGAIVTALRVAHAPWSLVVACDLPYLTKNWLEFLVARAAASKSDAVIAESSVGLQPLCAAYHKNAESKLRAALANGTRKVMDGLKHLHIETIEPAEWKRFDSDGLLFKNMNTPGDYEEARRRLEGSAKRDK